MKFEGACLLAQAFMAIGSRRTKTVDLTVDGVPDISYLDVIIESRLADREPLLVTFVNPASVAVARAQPGYQRALESFDLVLPDGCAMSAAIRWVHGIPAARVSFDSTSLAPHVLAMAERRGSSVALIGGVPGCATRAARRLTDALPQLRIVGCFDGYGDIDAKIRELAELDPDVVICGMGAGAQETVLLDLASQGWRGCGFTCGGYFDQLAQRFAYYPVWIDTFNLRWAYRLAREPRRLWRRYLLDYPVFVARLVRQLMFRPRLDRPAGLRMAKIDSNLARRGNAMALGTAQMKVDK